MTGKIKNETGFVFGVAPAKDGSWVMLIRATAQTPFNGEHVHTEIVAPFETMKDAIKVCGQRIKEKMNEPGFRKQLLKAVEDEQTEDQKPNSEKEETETKAGNDQE